MQSETNDSANRFLMRADRPWWRWHALSSIVLVVLLSVAGLATVITRELVQRQEEELLSERAAEVQVVVGQLVNQVQTSLLAAASTLTASGGDPAKFRSSVGALVTPTNTMWLVQRQANGQWTVTTQAGAPLDPSGATTPEVVAVIEDARATNGVQTSPVYSVDGQRRIGFAIATPAMNADSALLLQAPLGAPGTPTRVQADAFSEVNVALYADNRQLTEQLILTNTNDVPLGDSAEQRPIPVGSDQWVVAVSPDGTLIGNVTSKLPWMVLAAMALGAIAIAMLVEMTARRRDDALVQVDLRSQETDSILDAAEDAFISMDSSGRVLRWNRKAVELFGWTAQEAHGERVSELILPEDMRERHESGLVRFLETGEGWVINQRIEVDAMNKTGSTFPVELAIWPIERNGEYIFNAFLHDITARRAAADELNRAHMQALEASRLKSEFLANMSHEIRTPMNGVIGMTGLLLRTELDGEQREYAETVRASAEALLNVINDILDFSKIEAGRLELEVVDFDLRVTVEEVADLLADQAHSKGLEMVVAVERDVPRVLRGDAGRVRQILLNLVANAVKFTDEGEVVVRCSLDHSETDGDVVVHFAVKDTGIGISEEAQNRVFDTFTQVDASTTKRHEGTGLGLAIVRQLTELMGGEAGVSSTPGEGSTFWFTARFSPGNQQSVDEAAQAQGMADVAVIVVDDNATNTRILMRTLQDWGMRPVSAASATEAVEVMVAAAKAGFPYRLALLDYHMPDIDGLELAHAIVARSEISDTKLILLTSSGDRADRLGFREAGVSTCLTKPVRQAVLRSRIAQVLQSGGEGQSLAAARDVSQLRSAQSFHVLVAEDNVVNQRVASRMLEKIGCTVDLAANGQEAVDAVRRQPYALVLMDCQMPVMDGYEAARSIREHERKTGGHVPIIAMTASAMEGDRELALQAGMDDYLSKPVLLEDVFNVVERWAANDVYDAAAAETQPESTAVFASALSVDESAAETTPSGGHAEVLDLRIIETLRSMGSPDGVSLLAELAQRFDDSAREYMTQLRQAVAGGDAEMIRRIAHTLRGSGGAIGALQLSQLCTRLEEEASNDRYDAEGVAADVIRLEELVDLTVRSLRSQASID